MIFERFFFCGISLFSIVALLVWAIVVDLRAYTTGPYYWDDVSEFLRVFCEGCFWKAGWVMIGWFETSCNQ